MTDWGGFGSSDDLTPAELRQRLHSLEVILARAPVPIAIAHDPECRFISANRALADLLGLPREANISLTPPPGQRPPYRIQRNGVDIPQSELPMQYAIAHRTPVTNDIEIVREDGSVVYVQNDVEPLFDSHGRIIGCVSVIVDHTDRRLAEQVLREADRRKDEFLATLSHELRNPLAPIRTALEVMRLAPHDPGLVDRARTTMERQLLHMVRITDDLLDVARITQNKLQLRRERIDARTVIRTAIDAALPFIEAQGHTVDIDLPASPLWVDADATRLSQVLANLLNNAAKYTDRGGRISVSAAIGQSGVTVGVADTGVGIAPELLTQIFEMFTQLQPDRDRTHGGLGIGLTLAARLVELHGGRIEASSPGVGRGSRFTVHLPLAASSQPEASTDLQDPASPIVCRVLVADDNRDAAEMMKLMLELKGHDVRIALDGMEAVAVARDFVPQIAFLDIGMPRVDGYEAARQLRRFLGRRAALIALTGWGQDEDKRRSQEAGFDHHLTKPFEPEALERLIGDWLQRNAADGT